MTARAQPHGARYGPPPWMAAALVWLSMVLLAGCAAPITAFNNPPTSAVVGLAVDQSLPAATRPADPLQLPPIAPAGLRVAAAPAIAALAIDPLSPDRPVDLDAPAARGPSSTAAPGFAQRLEGATVQGVVGY